MKKNALFLLFLITSSFSFCLKADEKLYETGPSEDSSYVRFLNASDEKISVVNGAAKIDLGNQNETRVSRFYPVKAGSKLSAIAQLGSHKLPLHVTLNSGEFVTMAIVGKGAFAKSVIVREVPTDFNAMRSSISLSNLEESCTNASLVSGAKNTVIVENVKFGAVQRRLINPVKISIHVNCGENPIGKLLDVSPLQAGERYSVFLLPSKTERKIIFIHDGNI